MIYGYARVSKDGQSVAALVQELRDAGAEKITRETASGAKSDRAGLHERRPRVCEAGRREAWPQADSHTAPAEEAIKRVQAGKESIGQILRRCNVSRWTIQRL